MREGDDDEADRSRCEGIHWGEGGYYMNKVQKKETKYAIYFLN